MFRCSSILLLVLGTIAFAAPAPTPPPVRKGPSPEQIEKAIDDLASPRFAVREKASALLWEAGEHAEAALRVAAKSTDEEKSNRAKSILEKFDWGIYPDTPAEVIKQIEKFKGGDSPLRLEAVGELMRMKPTRFSTLRKVIAHESDENTRLQMYRTLSFEARKTVPSLIVSNQLDEAADLLEICVAPISPMSMGDYAAFHHLRNTVPDAIKRMESIRTRSSELESRRAAEALVYLHRVQKDWPAARKAADLAKNPFLTNDLAWESNDWKTLAKREVVPDNGPDFRGGETAAYQRLAGNQADYEKTMAELKKELMGVEGDDGSAYILAYALLLNSRGADAVNVLKEHPKHSPDLAFDLLIAQFRFKEAFDLAHEVSKELEKEEAIPSQRDDLDIERGRALAGLGEKDAATQVFRSILDRTLTGNRDRSIYNLIKVVARTGMRDLAAECIARTLVHNEKNGLASQASTYLEPILDDKKYAAQVWWQALRQEKPDAEVMGTMTRLLEFADGKADRKKVDHLVALIGKLKLWRDGSDLKKPVETDMPTFPQELTDFAIAEAYRCNGFAEKADEYFQKTISAKPAAPDPLAPPGLDEFLEDDAFPSPVPPQFKFLIIYADFLMTQKKPKDAAALYRKAWDLVPNEPLPLFLHGHALAQAGDAREGDRLKGLSHWVPLGNESSRSRFSEELSRRGFDEDSRREVDLTLATSWFRTHHVGNALLRVARLKARQGDYASAALYYEKDVIGLLRTGAHFTEPKAYLTVPELVRTYRARAALAAGKVDEALAEAKAGLVALPGNVEMAIGLVPDLDRLGKKKEADAIYSQVKAAFDTALKDYGSSPDLRNSLAWTMVNCNRDLEEARKHAEKAVQLSPKAAGYIDTLAEVHFRLKDRVKALELMKQCAALEPGNPYYRKQLVRFEKKPFDSPLPDEETGDD